MPRRWKPSIADQLEEVAASLVDVSYAVAAIAEQLREKPTKIGKNGAAFWHEPPDGGRERQDGGRRASKPRRTLPKF
jgi:hypothetical protein